MPSLNDVIHAFNKGFNYLSPHNTRNHRWFELTYKFKTWAHKYTHPDLTYELEITALNLRQDLEDLALDCGELEIDKIWSAFIGLIEKAHATASIKRFKYGKLITKHQSYVAPYSPVFHTTQSIEAKKPSYFEKMLVAGLNCIEQKFPELKSLLAPSLESIANASPLKVDALFEQGRLIHGNLHINQTFLSTMKGNYQHPEEREKFAAIMTAKRI